MAVYCLLADNLAPNVSICVLWIPQTFKSKIAPPLHACWPRRTGMHTPVHLPYSVWNLQYMYLHIHRILKFGFGYTKLWMICIPTRYYKISNNWLMLHVSCGDVVWILFVKMSSWKLPWSQRVLFSPVLNNPLLVKLTGVFGFIPHIWGFSGSFHTWLNWNIWILKCLY